MEQIRLRELRELGNMNMENIMRMWPILVMLGGLIATGSAAQFQITALAEDVSDQSESIDENEEAIDEIQRLLIQRQGQQTLDIQRIRSEIDQQNLKLDQLLNILEELKSR